MSVRIHFGASSDPSFMCDQCGQKYLVPQSVRWDPAVTTECAQAARDRGWYIAEYKIMCPTHAVLNRPSDSGNE